MTVSLLPFDRAVRVSGGVLLLATPILTRPTYPFNLLGLVLMVTGLVNFCPLYEIVARALRLFAGGAPEQRSSERLQVAHLRDQSRPHS